MDYIKLLPFSNYKIFYPPLQYGDLTSIEAVHLWGIAKLSFG
jgi:hypothetical protein